MPASKEDLRLKLMEVVNALSESQGSTPQEIIEILNAIPAQDFIKEDNWLSAFKIPPRRLVKINVASLAGA